MVALSLRDVQILCLCVFIHLFYRFRKKRSLPLPPGHTRWPIIGSVLSITLRYAHIYYKKLGNELGAKFVYYEVFGQPIIVVNSVQVAQDLLEKRPQIRTYSEGIGVDKFFGLLPYGDEWRAQRRNFQQYFGLNRLDQQLERNERMLRFVRRGLLPNLLTSPKDFPEHLKKSLYSLSITYCLPVQRQHDARVQFSGLVFAEIAAAASPAKFFISYISSLCQDIPEWMPGAGFKKTARDLRLRVEKLVEEPCQAMLELLDQGNVEESFVVAKLEKDRRTADSEVQVNHMMKYTAGQVFGGASETTTAAALTVILMMLRHPDIQREVQRELDLVIGPDRMPTMEDIPQLPYLSAVIRETLRWNPIAPLSVPRTTTDEDVYDGYYIPKGSVILTNIYAMLYDEDTYLEPSKFDPSRFIKDGILREDIPNPEVIATFGFGRRICPGSHIALPFTYLIAASILNLFDILPEVDEEGNPINVVPKFTPSSVTSEPCPLPCKITPRGDRNVTGLLKEYLDDGPV